MLGNFQTAGGRKEMLGGLGKILNVVRAVAPFLQFIPALAPFVKLFQIADQVANLVKNFKGGFPFLDLVSKFAPLPKGFDLSKIGGCFGLDSSKLNSLQNLLGETSKAFKAVNLVKNTVSDSSYINTVRTNTLRSSFISGR
jgi:hypothetical protein